MKNLFFNLIFASAFAYGNIGTYGFKDYKNYYFVETGTFTGEGIRKALKANCFSEIYSIEVSKGLANNAKVAFKDKKNVFIAEGDSKSVLWDIIKNMNKPITFWLDAHVYPPIKNKKNCPLIEELEQIKRHPIKNHKILIDDMHCCGTAAFDYLTRENLIEKIKEINSNYIVKFLPGGDDDSYLDNVLYAFVPDIKL